MTLSMDVSESKRKDKKYVAVFRVDGKRFRTTHFGQKGADDYTTTADGSARASYRARHFGDLEKGNPTSAGYLSWYILWGDTQDFKTNVKNYKQMFNLE